VIVVWAWAAWEDYIAWQSVDRSVVDKVNPLIKEIRRDHFGGRGKPEPLRGNFQGWWSRRITGEHRLVYRVIGNEDEKRLEIAQCRYHYGKS